MSKRSLNRKREGWNRDIGSDFGFLKEMGEESNSSINMVMNEAAIPLETSTSGDASFIEYAPQIFAHIRNIDNITIPNILEYIYS